MLRLLAALTGIYALAACDDTTGPADEFAFSFDSSLEGWVATGTDLNNPPVTWSIVQSAEQKRSGAGSAKFFLDNLNDAGKIWLARSFTLEPNTNYDVRIEYAFGTADYGSINLWQLITGAHTAPPQDAEDLSFRGDTGNGQQGNVGYRWVDKSYTVTARTDAQGRLWVAIGVWGTWETPRTYYIDDVKIEFEER
jgi:hypothetical protein